MSRVRLNVYNMSDEQDESDDAYSRLHVCCNFVELIVINNIFSVAVALVTHESLMFVRKVFVTFERVLHT